MSRNTEVALVGMLLAILIPLEIVAGLMAYETLSALTSLMVLAAVVLNLIPLVLMLRSRVLAGAAALLIALAIVPYQFYLGYRLMQVQAEVANIVAYAYEQRLTTGEYPQSLSDYAYLEPRTQPLIQHYEVDPNGQDFQVVYRVGTVNTSHWYNSETGWGYYPD